MRQRETMDTWLNALERSGIAMTRTGSNDHNGSCPLCGGEDRFHLRQTPERVLVGCRKCIDGRPQAIKRERYRMLRDEVFSTAGPERSSKRVLRAGRGSSARAEDLRAVHRAQLIWNATLAADHTPGSAYLIERRWCWPPEELGCVLPADVRWLPLANVASQRVPEGASGALVFAFRLRDQTLQAVHLEAIAPEGTRVPWPPSLADGEPQPRKTIGRLAGAYFRVPARKPGGLDTPAGRRGEVTLVEGVEDALAEHWASPYSDILAMARTIDGINPEEAKDYLQVRLAGDPDEAGQEAAASARDRLIQHGLAPSQLMNVCYPDADPADHWKRRLGQYPSGSAQPTNDRIESPEGFSSLARRWYAADPEWFLSRASESLGDQGEGS